MKVHTVIAEMVDRHTGNRHFPGERFTPADEGQRDHLVKAGCIREGVDPAAQARDQINNDGLFDKKPAELKALAKAEKVDIKGLNETSAIVAAIREARASRSAERPDYERDSLKDLALGDASKDQLLVIAAYEQADAPEGDAATEADLIKAIEAKRSAA